jgi:hypothetical protein
METITALPPQAHIGSGQLGDADIADAVLRTGLPLIIPRRVIVAGRSTALLIMRATTPVIAVINAPMRSGRRRTLRRPPSA